jgi:hypothetical protein
MRKNAPTRCWLVWLLVGLSGCAPLPMFNPFPAQVREERPPVREERPPVREESPPAPSLAWARTDGQLISGSPELTALARKDISECLATIPPVRTHLGVAGEACMTERGYYVLEIS